MISWSLVSLNLTGNRFIRYVLVGGTTFAMDFILLYLLHGKVGISLGIATSIAYWVAIIYNFFLNRSWTFSVRDMRSLHKHVVSYLTLLTFNYIFTVVFVSLASHSINYLLAKAIAVLIQMSWTYYVYKRFIFIESGDITDS